MCYRLTVCPADGGESSFAEGSSTAAEEEGNDEDEDEDDGLASEYGAWGMEGGDAEDSAFDEGDDEFVENFLFVVFVRKLLLGKHRAVAIQWVRKSSKSELSS